MVNYFQAIILGALQGVTELFPISSLGHSVILPKLLGWNINQKDPFFLIFLVATHAATALVLFIFFWSDWKKIIIGLASSLKEREINNYYAKLGWLLVVGTVPAGILGLLFEDLLKNLFASPVLVAVILVGNGLMLLIAENLGKTKRETTIKGSDQRIAQLNWWQIINVGVLQALALIPGLSRTGATITGGLVIGLSHEDAARLAFLLATPIIGAAALLKLPELITQTGFSDTGPILVGAITAGIFAYLSVKFLVKYFETNKLLPFAIYCLLFGGIVSGWFYFIR